MRIGLAPLALVALLFPTLVAAQAAQGTDAAMEGAALSGSEAATWRQRFGVYADMVGQGYFSATTDFTSAEAQQNQELGYFTDIDVQWAVPGERLSLVYRAPYGVNGEHTQESVATLLWDPATGQMLAGKASAPLVVLPDGSVLSPPKADANGTHRSMKRALDDGSFEISFDTLFDGQWETVRVVGIWPRTEENVEREQKKLADAYLARLAEAGIVPRHDPVWGPLASLAGSVWGARGHIIALVDRFEWIVPGETLKYVGGGEGFPSTEIAFRRGREPGTLIGKVSTLGEPSREVVFRHTGDGTIVSDWYRTLTLLGVGGLNQRHEFRLTPDGRYESRTATGNGRERPEFPPLHRQFRLHSEASIASIAQESRANVELFALRAREEHAEAERRAREERAQRWSMVMGAISGALDVGLDVARQQESQSRHNLDSTLAEINARAAAQQRVQNRPQRPSGQPQHRQASDWTSPGVDASGTSIPQGARSSPAVPVRADPPPSSSAGRQCRTESRTFTKKSIPLGSRELAENHVRGGMAGACPIRSTPSVGPLDCTEGSEAVWGKDERGVPVVTGRRAMFTCSATVTCSPVEVCASEPGSRASAQ